MKRITRSLGTLIGIIYAAAVIIAVGIMLQVLSDMYTR